MDYNDFNQVKQTFKIDIKSFDEWYVWTSGNLPSKLKQLSLVVDEKGCIDYNAEVLCLIFNDFTDYTDATVEDIEILLDFMYKEGYISVGHVFDTYLIGIPNILGWNVLSEEDCIEEKGDYFNNFEEESDWDDFGETYIYFKVNNKLYFY